MNVDISPSKATGTVQAPPSKSLGHRALLCGALSTGSTVRNLSFSKDIDATLGCLRALGAKTEAKDDTVLLGGLDPFSAEDGTTLFCNESGSTLRFFIPLCMLSGKRITLTGSERLFQRPLSIYEEIAQAQGISWEQSQDRLTVCGKLSAGDYSIPGNISSQFITGLLYALPLLEGNSTLTVTGSFESASYIDLTVDCLSQFGVQIHREGNVFSIPGKQRPLPRTYTVEADCSNAAFLDAFNLLGGNVKLTGIREDSLQGDRVYRSMFPLLGRKNTVFDLSDCPDLGPVMFAMAAAMGGGQFTGIARLRIKESDRVLAMTTELAKMGIRVTVEENTAQVHAGILKKPASFLCGHNDHRIVMALSLLCSVTGGTITGAEAVSKSFPDFFEKIQSLGIGVTIYDT